MLDATEFGKTLRELMAKNNLRQEQIAKALGVSSSILSNYITGKNIPETDFLAKCVKLFDLKNEKLFEFLYSAFLSAATSNHKIIADTRHVDPARIEMLAKTIAVLMLYPQADIISHELDQLFIQINYCMKRMKSDLQLRFPLAGIERK